MSAVERHTGSVEFAVKRIPTVRVLFGEWDDALIQIDAGEAPLNIRGTEDRLWILSREFTAQTNGAFADQAIDRARTHTAQFAAIEAKYLELSNENERIVRKLMLEQAMRERFEKELVSRDGFNRVRRQTEEFLAEIVHRNPQLREVDQR